MTEEQRNELSLAVAYVPLYVWLRSHAFVSDFVNVYNSTTCNEIDHIASTVTYD